MRYEGFQNNKKPVIDRIVEVVNLALFIVIVVCINYMVVKFLFR